MNLLDRMLEVLVVVAAVWTLQGVYWGVASALLLGDGGRRRLEAMDKDRFRRLERTHRRGEPFTQTVGTALSLVLVAVLAIDSGAAGLGLAALAVAALMLPACQASRLAARAVAREDERRALPPLVYQHSERGLALQRRLGRLLGAAAVVGFLVLTSGVWLERDWLSMVGVAMLLLCLLGGLAALWTGSWVFGDEEERQEER